MYEDQPVSLTCPVGNVSLQTWTRESDGADLPKQDVMQQIDTADDAGEELPSENKGDNVTRARYFIQHVKPSDGGLYTCTEGTVPVLVVQLEVIGECIIRHLKH